MSTGSPHGREGFTLLEVMVSLSILALAFVAIAGIQANSFEASNYARRITIATMLARSKMLDLELMLQDDGFSTSDKEESGDFSEEGYSEMRWTATIRKIEVDIAKLLGGFFGGEVSPETLPDQADKFLSGLRGDAPDDALNEAAEKSSLSQALGGEQMQLVFNQVSETLSESIREIALEIQWGKEGVDLESVKFVQYVTTTGRLSVPAGGFGTNNRSLTPGGRGQSSAVPPQTPGGRTNPAFRNLGLPNRTRE